MATVEYNADDNMATAFAACEAAAKARILYDTFGHLAPKRNKKYTGFIVFSYSAYGEIVLINDEFGDLDGSPWMYDAIYNYICQFPAERGNIYRFDGYVHN